MTQRDGNRHVKRMLIRGLSILLPVIIAALFSIFLLQTRIHTKVSIVIPGLLIMSTGTGAPFPGDKRDYLIGKLVEKSLISRGCITSSSNLFAYDDSLEIKANSALLEVDIKQASGDISVDCLIASAKDALRMVRSTVGDGSESSLTPEVLTTTVSLTRQYEEFGIFRAMIILIALLTTPAFAWPVVGGRGTPSDK